MTDAEKMGMTELEKEQFESDIDALVKMGLFKKVGDKYLISDPRITSEILKEFISDEVPDETH